MRYPILLLITLLCSGVPLTGAAQATPLRDGAPAGEIRGALLSSETGDPIAEASIAVLDAADSVVVTGVVTGADGSFRIDGLRPGRYTVRVTALGFAPLDRPGVEIAAGTPRAELGPIRLRPRRGDGRGG